MDYALVLGVVLRFVQEARADAAAAKLKAMISVTATVVRAGRPREIPIGELVPGVVVAPAPPVPCFAQITPHVVLVGEAIVARRAVLIHELGVFD